MSMKVFVALLASWIGIAQAANAPGSSARSTTAAPSAATTPAPPTVSATAGNDWLMLVATNSTDAARDAEFNAWYDDIDIPDVLEVPGYQRARRGLRLGTAAVPVSALPADEGRYVALYDIATYWSIMGGYRYLHFDIEKPRVRIDGRMSGIVLGVAYRQ